MRMTTMRFRAMRMRLRTMRMTTMRLRKMRTVATLEGKYDDIVLIMISTMKQRGGKKDCDKKKDQQKDFDNNREMTDLESTVATLEGSLKMVNENYVGLR